MELLKFSEMESEKMELQIYRAEEINDINYIDLLHEIFHKKADVVRLKIPFRNSDIFEQIENTALPYNVFKSLIRMTVFKESKNLYTYTHQELEFEQYEISQENILRSLLKYALSELTEIGFVNNIYNAIIDTEKMIELSAEYYISLANKGQLHGYFFYFAFINNECIGFCSFQIKDKKSEGLFYAIKPEYRSTGLAKELLAYSRVSSFLNGAEEFSTNTIIQNPRSVYPQMKIGLVPNETYMNILFFPLLAKRPILQTNLKADSFMDLCSKVNNWIVEQGYTSVLFKQIKSNLNQIIYFFVVFKVNFFVFDHKKIIISAISSDENSWVYFIGDNIKD